MKKLFIAVLMLSFCLMSLGIQASFAGEIDLLLQKLVDKGVLTGAEAQQVKTETQEQVKKEIAQGKFSSLPAWVQNTKLKGDFRLRYQDDYAKASNSGKQNNKQRARFRLRLGLESKVNDKLLVGVGLATGINTLASNGLTSADTSRSTNQTFGQGFGKAPISLDYAFAQYTPAPWATIVGGKFKNTLWEPGDLIWDTDINPVGASLKLNKNVNSAVSLFMNTGILTIMEDTGSGYQAPTMFMIQPGVTLKVNDAINIKGAVSYNQAFSVKGKLLNGAAGTNSGYTLSGSTVSGALLNDYTYINPALEASFKDPFKALGVGIPYLALFGEYVQNIESSVKNRNTGYMLGFKFGAEKVENFGDWQFRYNYAMLGRDAVLDITPDSDRYGGKTGIRSHEGMLDFGLGKNTWLGLDYYYGWQIPGNFAQTQSKPAQVFQLDWNMKF
jgi:hypothetical protein